MEHLYIYDLDCRGKQVRLSSLEIHARPRNTSSG